MMSESFELNLTAMSLLALMVGMFLIFNAISFSIVQRRNLLGRLREAAGIEAELQFATDLGTAQSDWRGAVRGADYAVESITPEGDTEDVVYRLLHEGAPRNYYRFRILEQLGR